MSEVIDSHCVHRVLHMLTLQSVAAEGFSAIMIVQTHGHVPVATVRSS